MAYIDRWAVRLVGEKKFHGLATYCGLISEVKTCMLCKHGGASCGNATIFSLVMLLISSPKKLLEALYGAVVTQKFVKVIKSNKIHSNKKFAEHHVGK